MAVCLAGPSAAVQLGGGVGGTAVGLQVASQAAVWVRRACWWWVPLGVLCGDEACCSWAWRWLASAIGRSARVVVPFFARARLAAGWAANAGEPVWWEIAAALAEFAPRARGRLSLRRWRASVRPDPVVERAVAAVVGVVRTAGRRSQRKWARVEALGILLPPVLRLLVTMIAAMAATPLQLLVRLPWAVAVALPRQ